VADKSKSKRAVVLAAGLGKRMKSDRPKVLHEVLGKPIIQRVVDSLDGLGLEHIHFVLGHKHAEITKYLEAHPPKVTWSVQIQEPQLGTGHALMQVVPGLEGFVGSLLVCAGDTPLLTQATFSDLFASHINQDAQVTVLTTIVEDPKKLWANRSRLHPARFSKSLRIKMQTKMKSRSKK